jgi:hypothetical protein
MARWNEYNRHIPKVMAEGSKIEEINYTEN